MVDPKNQSQASANFNKLYKEAKSLMSERVYSRRKNDKY